MATSTGNKRHPCSLVLPPDSCALCHTDRVRQTCLPVLDRAAYTSCESPGMDHALRKAEPGRSMDSSSLGLSLRITMTIERYRHPIFFYGLSTAIPWAFWFAAAYVSHITPSNEFLATAVGVLGVIGLVAPTVIAFWMIWPQADL